MVFSFNFNIDKDVGTQQEDVKDPESQKIEWKEAQEIFLSDEHFKRVSALQEIENFYLGDLNIEEDINKDKNILEAVDNNDSKEDGEQKIVDNQNDSEKEKQEMIPIKEKFQFLNFINSETVAVNLKSDGYKGDLEKALEDNTDLVPGVYEGGLKIWECSEDLVRYLYKEYSDKLAGTKVLEVGCGAGLPGVFTFAAGANTHFNDYNREVLDEITIPNVLLNVKEEDCSLDKFNNSEQSFPETRYFCGDWEHLNTLLKKTLPEPTDKYDLILTSETIYNPNNHHKLVTLIKDQLKRGKVGVALIAAKSYYFGVGGGIKQFQGVLEEAGFHVETVFKCDSGVKREILAARLD